MDIDRRFAKHAPVPNPYDNPFWGKPPPEPKPNRWLWIVAMLFCIGVYAWIAQYLGG